MTKITNFVWNPVDDCIISEVDETGTVQAVYTNEPQQYGGVISQRRGTTTSTYHADALGSTRFLTDSSGNVTDTYLNDGWGNHVASTGTTVNPFKWVGKYGYYTDDSTGQVYVRARMYQPAVARWVSIDQMLFELSRHAYAYALSQPSQLADASGFAPPWTCGVDVSEWFNQILKSIYAEMSTRMPPLGGNWHQTFWKSLKFELSGAIDDRADPCRECGSCPNSVTLCGHCINVTELGNIALGVAAGIGSAPVLGNYNEPGIALWGGFKIGLNGRGFDKFDDILGGMLGAMLKLSGFPRKSFCEIVDGPMRFDLFDRIVVEVWSQNARWAMYTALPGGPPYQNVLEEWDAKYAKLLGGTWRELLQKAFRSLLTTRLGAFEGKESSCAPCDRIWNPNSTFSIDPNGAVVW